jgi:hypothetical protein
MCTVEAKRIVGWALQGVTDQASFPLLQRLSRIHRLTFNSPLKPLPWCVLLLSSFPFILVVATKKDKKTILLRGLSRP